MTFIRGFYVLIILSVNAGGVLSAALANVNEVSIYGVLSAALGDVGGARGMINQINVINEVSSIKELEHLFKNVYTVSDFLFNKSKIVGNEVWKWEEVARNETKVVIAHAVANLQLMSDGCQCEGYSCGCCAHLEEDEIHLNSTICVNVSYLPNDYGISFVMTLNDYVLYNETISVRNPPPICIGMPFVKEFAELCARLYDIDAQATKLHACVRVEARLKHVLIAKYDLGCFDIGKLEDWVVEVENSFVPSVIRI